MAVAPPAQLVAAIVGIGTFVKPTGSTSTIGVLSFASSLMAHGRTSDTTRWKSPSAAPVIHRSAGPDPFPSDRYGPAW